MYVNTVNFPVFGPQWITACRESSLSLYVICVFVDLHFAAENQRFRR